MSPENWEKVDNALQFFYGSIKLRCDGYVVRLILMPSGSRFRNAIRVYVNGKIKGAWYLEDCEERRRFFCPKRNYLWGWKRRAELKKMGKRALKRLNIDPKAVHVSYSTDWTSFRRMKAHFIKNNEKIELIEEEVVA